MDPRNQWKLGLRQRDGVTCGPSVAILGGALLDPGGYGAPLAGGKVRDWFASEQGDVHDAVNRVWPRRLGTTPAGVARALNVQSRRLGVRYGWRMYFGGERRLNETVAAVSAGWPVAMLVGKIVPRHWVLIIGADGHTVQCYEPSSGEVRPAGTAAIRRGRLTGLGFPRVFAFVLPTTRPLPRFPNPSPGTAPPPAHH